MKKWDIIEKGEKHFQCIDLIKEKLRKLSFKEIIKHKDLSKVVQFISNY